MEIEVGCTDNEHGTSNEYPDNRAELFGVREGNIQMSQLFLNAFFAVRGFHGGMLERARTERGASMVEYALLVGLIAVVAVVAIAALGGGISGLFSNANKCVGGLNATNC
jgi:pilus assembly protein Flp/PilA